MGFFTSPQADLIPPQADLILRETRISLYRFVRETFPIAALSFT
jgi:hypothetical protein